MQHVEAEAEQREIEEFDRPSSARAITTRQKPIVTPPICINRRSPNNGSSRETETP